MRRLEFFFDVSSPWTYLAFTGIQPVCQRLGMDPEHDIQWRPILVGGVFNAINPGLYQNRENMFKDERRSRHYFKDLKDWADFHQIRIGQPPVFPVNSVKAMRGCLVAQEHDRLVPYAKACFERYWGELDDISRDQVLAEIAASVDLDPEAFFTAIGQQDYKDRLRANTDELIQRGGFGSPTLFIDGDDMYFGNDRLPLVERALSR